MFESIADRRRARRTPILAIIGVVLVTLGVLAYCRHDRATRAHDDMSSFALPYAPLAGEAETPVIVPASKPYVAPNHAVVPTCPAGTVAIPGGMFYIGSPDFDARETPVHGVSLSSFCLDRTEVTVAAYAKCVATGACEPAAVEVTPGSMTPHQIALENPACNGNRADRQNHPVNCVDWNQAAAYCTWIDRRLPTEAEWEYAAIGTENRVFVWGNDRPTAKHFNGCGSECIGLVRDIVERPTFKPLYDGDDGWPTTAPVGNFATDTSVFGALDMSGNVSEWVSDWMGPYANDIQINPTGPSTGTARIQRGGSWADSSRAGPHVSMRGEREPGTRGIAVGFRCAQYPATKR